MGGKTAKALVAAMALVVTSTAGGKPIPESPLKGKLSADFAPRMLAKKGQTPIALRASGRFWMNDGSPLPPLRWYRLRVDRHMRLTLGEVPVCKGGVRSQPRGEGVPGHCRDSMVGQVSMRVNVRFPGAAPTLVDGEGIIYRGPAREGGGPLLFMNVFFPAPVTAEVVVPIEVKLTAGELYGPRMEATFPKIAGSYGSVVHMALGFKKGTFTAFCPPNGQLLINQRTVFDDHSIWTGSSGRACTTSG